MRNELSKTDENTTVYLVEDEDEVSASLRALLTAHGYTVVACASGEAFLECFDASAKAVMLLDLRLPGMSGMELQAHLNETGHHIPIVILTAHGDVPVAVQSMRAGAYDFIEKPSDPDRLLDTLGEAVDIVFNRPSSGPSKQLVAERLAKLTDREREVLGHLLQGKLNKEIADELGLSRRTVEVHRSRVREKMHARGIADLIRMMG